MKAIPHFRAEGCAPFRERSRPNLQLLIHPRRSFTSEQVIVLEHAFKQSNAELVKQEGEVTQNFYGLFVLPCLDELIDALSKSANAVRLPFFLRVNSFGARSEIVRQPPVRLPTVLGRFHEMLLHPFGHLTVVERHHVGTGSGPLVR